MDPIDPQGMRALAEEHLEWLRVSNYSERTVETRADYLRYFAAWCADRGVFRPLEVTKPILERYQHFLFHYRKKNGEPLSFRSQRNRLTALRSFFKWLAKGNHILYNPASELELPKVDHRLPKFVLSVPEAEQVLAQPDLEDPLGLRDRAILETLYSTGIRRMELVGLQLYDLDRDRGTIMVRQGKGKKDRMIPIGARALAWIDKYLAESRPQLATGSNETALFITSHGSPFEPHHLSYRVRRYVDQADIGKKGSCHLFRHTMATLMLDGGADIRFIQQMLGHAKLETTQIYTQVAIRKLKEIHDATHPAKLHRTERSGEVDDEASG